MNGFTTTASPSRVVPLVRVVSIAAWVRSFTRYHFHAYYCFSIHEWDRVMRYFGDLSNTVQLEKAWPDSIATSSHALPTPSRTAPRALHTPIEYAYRILTAVFEPRHQGFAIVCKSHEGRFKTHRRLQWLHIPAKEPIKAAHTGVHENWEQMSLIVGIRPSSILETSVVQHYPRLCESSKDLHWTMKVSNKDSGQRMFNSMSKDVHSLLSSPVCKDMFSLVIWQTTPYQHKTSMKTTHWKYKRQIFIYVQC